MCILVLVGGEFNLGPKINHRQSNLSRRDYLLFFWYSGPQGRCEETSFPNGEEAISAFEDALPRPKYYNPWTLFLFHAHPMTTSMPVVNFFVINLQCLLRVFYMIPQVSLGYVNSFVSRKSAIFQPSACFSCWTCRKVQPVSSKASYT